MRGMTGMLSVVCPVYNEAENIKFMVDELEAKVSVPMELLVVFDHDDDNTIPVVLSAQYPFKIRLLKNKFGVGVLPAIRTGFAESQGEAVLVVMADLSDDFSVVNEMYRLITDEGFDIVCGSRYMHGGRQVGGSLIKKFFSKSIGLSLHYLVGLPTHDITNSFKMYKSQFLKGIAIESEGGFEIGMELVAKAFINGGKIAELPAKWKDRTAGKSRFHMRKWASGYFRWYLYIWKKLWRKKSSLA